MKIGTLAQATATPVDTIRFYEREGLLPSPARTDANYRVYTPAHAERLAFIRRCRGLDMTLDEVRTLLGFIDRPAQDCQAVNALLDEHIGHVAQRISELTRLEAELRTLRAQCQVPGSNARCGILQELSVPGSAHPVQAAVHAHLGSTHRPRRP